MSARSRRSPGVHVPPPLLFVTGFGLGWFLGRSVPLSVFPAAWTPVTLVGGWLSVAGGLTLMLVCILTFLEAGTAVFPNRPASALVTTGPYRFSRNPMYLGLTAAYLGGVLFSNSAWCLVTLPLVLLAVYGFVIRREERYLEGEFGQAYRSYCERTRRWL